MITSNKPNWIFAIGIPSVIFLTCFLITLSPKFKLNQDLVSNAILFDLLVSAPLIYFLLIRKSSVSKMTIARVFIAGLLVAGWILNTETNIVLHVVKTWIFPLIEGTLLFFIGKKFYAAAKLSKQTGNKSFDFLIWCRNLLHHIFGNEKAGDIIGSEIAVLYYTFAGRKAKNIDYQTTFTSYKENGIISILVTFLSLFLVETIGVHFLLRLWNELIAWTLTGLSFYTCMQLFAHIRAVKARPLHIGQDSLDIHNGLAGDVSIKYDNIERIELSKKTPSNTNTVKIALISGFENHNCMIHLKNPVDVKKIFGIKKRSSTVLFFVDRSKEFITAMNLKLVQKIN